MARTRTTRLSLAVFLSRLSTKAGADEVELFESDFLGCHAEDPRGFPLTNSLTNWDLRFDAWRDVLRYWVKYPRLGVLGSRQRVSEEVRPSDEITAERMRRTYGRRRLSIPTPGEHDSLTRRRSR